MRRPRAARSFTILSTARESSAARSSAASRLHAFLSCGSIRNTSPSVARAAAWLPNRVSVLPRNASAAARSVSVAASVSTNPLWRVPTAYRPASHATDAHATAAVSRPNQARPLVQVGVALRQRDRSSNASDCSSSEARRWRSTGHAAICRVSSQMQHRRAPRWRFLSPSYRYRPPARRTCPDGKLRLLSALATAWLLGGKLVIYSLTSAVPLRLIDPTRNRLAVIASFLPHEVMRTSYLGEVADSRFSVNCWLRRTVRPPVMISRQSG